MLNRLFRIRSLHPVRLLVAVTMASAVLAPRAASAQQADGWQGTFSPMYFWATKIDGEVTAAGRTAPVFLSFADAAGNLAGAFSFHLEARKRRVGVFSDLSFIRLGSDADFTIPGTSPIRTINGDFDLNNILFEIGGSYLLSEPAQFAVIAGVRTYTLSPKLEFTTGSAEFEPIDASRTSVNALVGFTYRPRLAEKVTLLSRADVGGGGGYTWSGLIGLEYRPKPWAGLILGYKALGIDVGSETDNDKTIREYDVTHYGPIFGLNLHWGGR